MTMCYDDENKLERCLFVASKKKEYVAPHTHAIFIEAVNLLAASDPEAGVDDIKYGGDLYEEDIDDQ